MKKLLSLIFLLLAVLQANADTWTDSNGISWTFTVSGSNATNVEPSDKTSISGVVVIPSKMNSYTVTSIGNNAFHSCSSLTSVTIPNSVTSIGQSAFYNCLDLTAVHISDLEAWCKISFISYDSNPLYYAHHLYLNGEEIKNLVIPNSVTSIDGFVFRGCSDLTSVTIPSSVTSIGVGAFADCRGLTSVTIPNSVTSIGDGAFYECSGLTSVTIPNSVKSIGYSAFQGCSGLTSVNIPNSVTSIDRQTFYGCSSLTSVTIGNSVKSIGYMAFAGCSGLVSITIPNSVTSIGNSAFSGCTGLTSVISEIETPFEITSNVFSSDTYTNATLMVPIGKKSAYEATNYWNKFENIEEVTPNIVFADANVKALCVANWDTNGDGELSTEEAAAVTNLGTVYKNNTAITSFDELSFFTGLTSIGQNAFYKCSSLTSVTIPNSVTSIGNYAFDSCSGLTSVTIPNSVTSIGGHAFRGCSSLTSVTIPNGVTSIGNYAFSYCDGITSINVESGNTVYDSRGNCNAIIKTSTNGMVAGCKNTAIPNSVTSINAGAFCGCSSLTSVSIPNSVTFIGGSAFDNCSGLTSVTIPNSVTSISNSAFRNCSGLTSVTIGSSVTSIGDYAFSGCSGLTSVTIPNSVTSIGQQAFQGCSGLTSITIPNSVTSIGGGAFYGCSGLTSVTIPNSVKAINQYAFYGCSGLTSVTIPNSVTSIDNLAFDGCSGLTSFVVEWDTPITISSNVFQDSNYENANLYVPKGSKGAYQGADYWNSCKAIKEYPDSDVNQDGEIDVVDVVDIARYVVGTPAESFDVFLADINSDKTVNVADAVVLVNDIAGDTNWSRSMRAPQSIHNDVLALTENNDHSLSLQLEGDGRYTAFQFDLMLPADTDVMQMMLNGQRKQSHQLLYNKVSESHYRVVALSTSNREFGGTSGELLNIVLDGFAADGIVVDNIHFITPEGADVPFEAITLSMSSETTGISHTSEDTELQQKVYNLNGQRIAAPRKGLNIINGKKVMIK